MKFWMKNKMVAAVVALLLTTCLLSIGGAVLASDTDTGIPGVKGPTFTFGVVLLSSTGGGGDGATGEFANAFPWGLTGYALSKSEGSITVWLSSGSEAVMKLGFKPGDIITIYCTPEQVEGINAGDWVLLTGFTARGQLAFASQLVLPAPFSY
jgi:hypothetical protein